MTVHITLCHADALDVLRATPAESVDAVVTDPPYGLADHAPDVIASAITAWARGDRERVPDGRGFMGRRWDRFVPPPAVWDECMRVLRPGGHLAVFAGSRTVDLMGLSIRLAGFEMRDGIAAWLYGSGFPKSRNVGKAAAEAGRRWDGWGTALKPAHEPILIARKPLSGTVAANVLEHGTGAINVNACRVGAVTDDPRGMHRSQRGTSQAWEGGAFSGERTNGSDGGRWPTNVTLAHHPGCGPDESPGPCVPGCQVAALDEQSGASRFFPTFRYQAKAPRQERVRAWGASCVCDARPLDPETGALPPQWRAGTECSRCGRPAEFRGHKTVKPLALLEWLVRLLCRPGGTVLDPFAGSGTTGEAAGLVGCSAILFENDDHSALLIEQRLGVVAVDLYPVDAALVTVPA